MMSVSTNCTTEIVRYPPRQLFSPDEAEAHHIGADGGADAQQQCSQFMCAIKRLAMWGQLLARKTALIFLRPTTQ